MNRLTLKHGDVIKVNGKGSFNRQRVGTISGYAAQYGEYGDIVDERIARAHSRGHQIVWLSAECVVIAADPSTVDRSYLAVVEPGQEVYIEGHAEERGIYRVELPGRLGGDHCKLVRIELPYEVETGVKGATRINRRSYATLDEALEKAERWSKSNSQGSYWAEVVDRSSGTRRTIKRFNLDDPS